MASQRPIPYIKIIHQPSSIYRMRYRAENRKTFLYAENYTAGAANTTPNSGTSTPVTSNELTNSAGKKNAKKKNVPIASASTSSTTPTPTSATVSPSKIEPVDGVFPKIEVKLRSYLLLQNLKNLNASQYLNFYLKIVNGFGPATLIVSCVNKTEPHHVHPHRLVGNQCKSGVAVLKM